MQDLETIRTKFHYYSERYPSFFLVVRDALTCEVTRSAKEGTCKSESFKVYKCLKTFNEKTRTEIFNEFRNIQKTLTNDWEDVAPATVKFFEFVESLINK